MVLCLSFYGYWSLRSLVLLPFLALLLAKDWRNRVACLLVFAIGVAGALPFLYGPAQFRWTGLSTMLMQGNGLQQTGYAVLLDRAWTALATLWSSAGGDLWLSLRNGGMHPVVILILALFGLLGGVRASILIVTAFLAGLTPGVFGYGGGVSTHRLTVAYAMIPIAAARGIDLLRKFNVAHVLVAVWLMSITADQALGIYFGDLYQAYMRFWFDGARTALIRDFPADKMVYFRDLWGFAELRHLDLGPQRVRWLTPRNWLLEDSYHAICATEAVKTFYVGLLGDENIRSYAPKPSRLGGAGDATTCFLAYIPRDTWTGAHGWRYTSSCVDIVDETETLPTLYLNQDYRELLPCMGNAGGRMGDAGGRRFTFDARWIGEKHKVEFVTNGTGVNVEIVVDGVRAIANPELPTFNATLKPGSVVRVSGQWPGSLLVAMYVMDQDVPRLARWDETEPVGGLGQLACAEDQCFAQANDLVPEPPPGRGLNARTPRSTDTSSPAGRRRSAAGKGLASR
jgi:hypothetical protein